MSRPAPTWDVAVVGAGPAGSQCAADLACRGYGVVLLDASPGTRQEIICTGIIGAEGFARFRIPASSVLLVLSKTKFISPGGRVLECVTEQPFAYVVDRHRFDGALQQRAVEQGAQLCFGFRAKGVDWVRGVIRVHGLLHGEPHAIQARAVVFATGFNRGLARKLGLEEPRNLVQGVQAEISLRDLTTAEVYFGQRFAPGFFAWVVPIGASRARVGLLVRRQGRKYFQKFLNGTGLRARIQRFPSTITSRPILQGALQRTASNHFLIVGEAAGQVKTTTGGGIYYGLLCGELAAEALDEAFKKGDVSQAALMKYHWRWTQLLGPELRAGLRLQRLGAAMSDAEIDQLFQAIASDGFLSRLQERFQFDWHRSMILFLLRNLSLARSLFRSNSGAALPRALPLC